MSLVKESSFDNLKNLCNSFDRLLDKHSEVILAMEESINITFGKEDEENECKPYHNERQQAIQSSK